METSQVISVLSLLLDGVDPTTLEKLPPDSAVAAPDVVHALHAAREVVGIHLSCGTAPRRAAAAGKPWTSEEDSRLRSEFAAGKPASEIATLHERTKGGINSRLVHLGLVDASTVKVRTR